VRIGTAASPKVKRIRLLSLVDAMSGGAGAVAARLIRDLTDMEHVAACIEGSVSFSYGCVAVAKAAGARVVPLRGTSASELAAALSALLLEYRPHAILHHWWGGCTTEAALALTPEFTQIPGILISHTNDPSPNSYAFYVSVSRHNACFHRDNIKYDGRGRAVNHVTIPNAVDCRFGITDRAFNGGHSLRVCTLQPFKIEADWLEFVTTIGPPHTAHTLVGDGPMLGLFRKAAKSLPGRSIVITGPLVNASDRFCRIIAEADVFLWESVKPEAAPLAILEALAAGIPVVADRNGVLPEIISDGRTGLLYGSRDELRELCRQVLSDRNLWRSLSTAAAQTARQYTTRDMSEHYRCVIAKVASL
jgi:Glycosyl transferases group 1